MGLDFVYNFLFRYCNNAKFKYLNLLTHLAEKVFSNTRLIMRPALDHVQGNERFNSTIFSYACGSKTKIQKDQR
uniref:Uncharacterized protein n=1 Tax=Rhizophora mucronata TaxID=61149 RepID=A0A2P2MNS6_RHIMU